MPLVVEVPCGRGLFLGLGLTMGSAGLGRRITGGGPPLGIQPGVRSAGEALIAVMSMDRSLEGFDLGEF